MKQMAYYALAAVLLMGAGCKKKNQASVEPTDKPAPAQTQPAITTPEANETTPITDKAKEVAQTAVEETKEAISALKVKTEDVVADLGLSVDAIKQKVAGFDKTQLLAYADKYKGMIVEKKDQIAAVTDQIKSLPVTEMMGEKAKALKGQLAQYGSDLEALKERYVVYFDKLTAMGEQPDTESSSTP